MAIRFSWDPVKAAANERKHGITFEEAATAFGDELSLTIPDPDHSTDEDRYILVGRSDRNRLLLVVHTVVDEVVRLISARRATRRERHTYEEDIQG